MSMQRRASHSHLLHIDQLSTLETETPASLLHLSKTVPATAGMLPSPIKTRKISHKKSKPPKPPNKPAIKSPGRKVTVNSTLETSLLDVKKDRIVAPMGKYSI